jgi:O-acetyl-ADP-ribose deacetylase (regulator of RNase III)
MARLRQLDDYEDAALERAWQGPGSGVAAESCALHAMRVRSGRSPVDPRRPSSGSGRSRNVDEHEGDMKITVKVGSIVDPAVGCHAIVNASNPSVALGSGVSGAIRGACGGAAYQAEVRAALEDEFGEPLGIGDCLATTAGTAQAFRWVLHVPAVDYRVRDPETGGVTGPTRVNACVVSALDEAADLASRHGLAGALRVALPLLGAGHGGLGAVASAELMVEAIRGWLDAQEGPAPLAELRFVVLDEPTARIVQHALAK